MKSPKRPRDELHRSGFGEGEREAGCFRRADDHALGRDGIFDLLQLSKRCDGVKENDHRHQNEYNGYNGKNASPGVNTSADIEKHQQGKHSAYSEKPAQIAHPVFAVYEFAGF